MANGKIVRLRLRWVLVLGRIRRLAAYVGLWLMRQVVVTQPVAASERSYPLWRVERWQDDRVWVVQVYRSGEWFAGASAPTLSLAWRMTRMEAKGRLRAMQRVAKLPQPPAAPPVVLS